MQIFVFVWHKKMPQPSKGATRSSSMKTYHQVCLSTKGWSLKTFSKHFLNCRRTLNNSRADEFLHWIFLVWVHIQQTFSTPRYLNCQIHCAVELRLGQIFNISTFPSFPFYIRTQISRVVVHWLVFKILICMFLPVWSGNTSFERNS